MNTNYYTSYRKHIGKRSGTKPGPTFCWAVDPEKFKKSQTKVIYDECGIKYTRAEFDAMLGQCTIHQTDLVGRTFL